MKEDGSKDNNMVKENTHIRMEKLNILCMIMVKGQNGFQKKILNLIRPQNSYNSHKIILQFEKPTNKLIILTIILL